MMIHPDISVALVRERVKTFMGEAQAAHQVRLARAARSPANGKRVGLPQYDQRSQPVSQPC
jgi:hypothetical protein